MINLSDEIKEAYQRDRTDINLVIQFSNDIPTINNSSLLIESMSFSEILSDESQLKFGGCNASRFEVTIINPNEAITNGVTITPYLEIRGIEGSKINLGTFIITDMQKHKDNPYTHIVALDKMQLLNVDVVEWYNSLEFPMTVKAYRDSFFEYYGIEQKTVTLPMDNLTINRLYTSEALNGLVVARDICEANGRFGRMGRDGKFEYVKLASVLFNSTDITPYLKEKPSFNTFLTQFIDGIKVMSSDGTLYKQNLDAENEYIVTSGLFNNKTEEELEEMCDILLDEIEGVNYQPINDLVMKGLPFIENGDNIKFLSGGSFVYSYAFTRETQGIKALTDTIYSYGSEKLVYDENSLQNQLLKLKRDGEQLKIDVSATNQGLSFKVDKEVYSEYQNSIQSQFQQTGESIQTTFSQSVQDAKEYTDNQTSATTEGFQELMTYIKLDADGITIGKNDNRLTLQLSNDAILFLNDGQPIGSWDGTNFHTGNIVVDINRRAQFGNFAYIPRSDGSLMFLKVQ